MPYSITWSALAKSEKHEADDEWDTRAVVELLSRHLSVIESFESEDDLLRNFEVCRDLSKSLGPTWAQEIRDAVVNRQL